MRYLLSFILLLAFSGICQQKFFIKYKDEISSQAIDRKIKEKSMFVLPESPGSAGTVYSASRFTDAPELRDHRLGRILRVLITGNYSEADLRKMLADPDQIEYVETNKSFKIDFVPNDSLYSQQWALSKIDAPKAWSYTLGSDTVLIGVIDTGIDYNHPDIKNKIYINPGETGLDNLGRDKRSNGVDDDGNGFIDDWHGWDFVDRAGFPYDTLIGDYKGWDNDPMDEYPESHGTAVSGIIAAETNNAIGVAGVAPNVKILNIRSFDPDGTSDEDDAAAGILYAVRMKAKVINMSWGDLSYSFVLRDVIQYAYSKNIVLVASSGNTNINTPHYPSAFPGVISVGNSTSEDYVSGNSTWGSTLSLVAPGTDIIALARGYSYETINGTSAAAPFVSGTAGLILSMGNYTADEVKQIIKSTTDDIGTEGWDEHSGAGRLNTGRALQVLTPSRIKFEYPIQDFSTSKDTIHVSASIMSSYFSEFSLSWGLGISPSSWTTVVSGKKYQVFKSEIGTVDLAGVKDTVITLRIQVILANGRTLEERVNVTVIRNAFGVTVIRPFPAYYGNSVTITAAVYSTNVTVAKMYYKLKGSPEYANISLDGLNINNLFVQNLHYGFVPQGIIRPDTVYEVYFELKNMLGSTLFVKDSDGADYKVYTHDFIRQAQINKLNYSLPKGTIYPLPVTFSGKSSSDVFFSPSSSNGIVKTMSNDGTGFVLEDSLSERIIKDVGDFNNDGLTDVLALWGMNGYLLTQQSGGSAKLVEKNKVEDNKFWPVLVNDIDKDGSKELLALVKDSVCVYRVKSDFSLQYLTSFADTITGPIGGNFFNYPSAVVTDADNDGRNEVWMADYGGDVLCFNVMPGPKLVLDTLRSFSTSFLSSSSWLAAGDFNGDGKPEIAVLLHSIEALHAAQYYRALILGFDGSSMNIMFDRCFIDPASSFKVLAKTYDNIGFARVYSSNKDDFILNVFPYMYIFTWENNQPRAVLYRDNVNSNCVFAGDLNNNGKLEFGLGEINSFNFYEFADAAFPSIPTDIKGRSVNAAKIHLNWHGDGVKYYIYKAVSPDSLKLIDSVSGNTYDDSNVALGRMYYYAVKAVNSAGKVSILSAALPVYHHPVTYLNSFSVLPGRKVEIFFSERMPRTVYHLESYKLGIPGGGTIDVGTVVLSGDKSMVLSFPSDIAAGTYKVILTGMADYYDAAVPDTSFQVTFTDEPAEKMFFIESFKLLDEHRLSITFNIPADSLSALNKLNYKIQPERKISSLFFADNNHRELIITIEKGRPFGALGSESILQVTNVYSSAAYGGLKIKENAAGSNIVLSLNAKNPDNVYVFPNPARISGANPQLTFANLPRYTEITIFDLSGKKVKVLTGITGTGGLTWNLRNEENELVGSGVYFYRVRQLDENNDELTTKLQKFTVVK